MFSRSRIQSIVPHRMTGILNKANRFQDFSRAKGDHSTVFIAQNALRSPGRPLDPSTRRFMEARFGHDFSRVRVHADGKAAVSAQAVNARAFTVGRDVVFGPGEYAPGSQEGQRLLAHELAHVVQQDRSGAGAPSQGLRIGSPSSPAEQEARQSAAHILAGGTAAPEASVAPGTVQRDNGDSSGSSETEGEEERLRLQWPGLRTSPFLRLRLVPELQLRLDPEIQAQIAAMRMMQELLNPDQIRSSFLHIDFNTLLTTPPSPRLTGAPTPAPAPLVPRGAGPSTPRPGKPGDIMRAILAVPAVNTALTRLRTQAEDRVRRDWRRLSTGERVLLVTQTALIGGAALAGVLSDPEARQFVLGQIENRTIPVPGVPGLTFQFNVTGPDRRIMFNLNLGALLPPILGFH